MKTTNKFIACILIFMCTLFFCGFNYIVQQTDYNCVPASIEMIYKMFGQDKISQYTIRKELQTPSGVVPTDDMIHYLDKYFVYEKKRICCEDSLINSFGEYPILILYDEQVMNIFSSYRGHCVVGLQLEEKDGVSYIKTLDPDGARVSFKNFNKMLKSIKQWNDEIYIVKGLKQKK